MYSMVNGTQRCFVIRFPDPLCQLYEFFADSHRVFPFYAYFDYSGGSLQMAFLDQSI
jgi:hypothetical protein